MKKSIVDILINIFIIVIGVVFIVTRSGSAKSAINWNKIVGYRYNERGFEIAYLVVGVIFIVVGVLSLIGIIKVK
jgi:hypothetical protein